MSRRSESIPTSGAIAGGGGDGDEAEASAASRNRFLRSMCLGVILLAGCRNIRRLFGSGAAASTKFEVDLRLGGRM